jgi:hypothetical protein
MGIAVFSASWGVACGRHWVRSVFHIFREGVGLGLQEAVEVLDGAAIEVLRLRVKAEECGDDVGLAAVAIEAEGEAEGVVLGEDAGPVGGIQGAVGAVGVEAGLEGVEAEHRGLGERDPFDGGTLLGADGLAGGDGAGDAGID